ncbi:hypothetical protein PRUPE_8G037300 [Prunus persica]|uniref:FAR1 domain-containing protein n=1 Tax=Prunus persica TaxID=3760 RepID=M5VLT9_PRUPE|nr:hypothetical protein PRUPE_8G037300 [Prunus persica]
MDVNTEVENQVDGIEEDNNKMNDEVGVILIVSMNLEPQVGKEFNSLDDVYEFYKTYARNSEFGIRKHSSKRIRFTNEIIRKEFVCCRQGCYEPPKDPKHKRM